MKKLLIDLVAISPSILHRFDFESCSKSLVHLSLVDFDRSFQKKMGAVDEFVNSFNLFKTLENLKVFSIIGDYTYRYTLNGIEYLKDLR